MIAAVQPDYTPEEDASMAAMYDEFNTGHLTSGDSTIGTTATLTPDPASPETNLGTNGLSLDPSAANQSELEPQEWGGGPTIAEPSIDDQLSLSGVTDPPPAFENTSLENVATGSGIAASQPGANTPVAQSTGFLAAFSKFGSSVGAIFSGAGSSNSKLITPPGTTKPVPNHLALALIAILTLIAVSIVFGGSAKG